MRYIKTKIVIVFTLTSILAGHAYSYSQEMRAETLKGPWELSIQMQHGATGGVSFPISVEDDSKPGKLINNLPIVGKPIRVRLQEYVPDLQWETTIVHKDNGGIIAEMRITGDNVDQTVFVDSDDDKKKTILATGIGELTARKFYDKNLVKKIADNIGDAKVFGIVSVWLKGSDEPVEFLATDGGTFIVPGTNYRITVQQYMSHYSIDTETREIVNISDKHVNPAVKIKTEIDGKPREQWLWSKFPSYPHAGTELPFRIEYSAFRVAEKGDHLMAGAADSQAYMFYIKDGKSVAEKAEIDKQYSFKNEAYSFSLVTIRNQAAIETKWVNKSESLNNPAIIASILQNGQEKQAILELNKPYNYQSDGEPLTFVFRKKQDSKDMEHLVN